MRKGMSLIACSLSLSGFLVSGGIGQAHTGDSVNIAYGTMGNKENVLQPDSVPGQESGVHSKGNPGYIPNDPTFTPSSRSRPPVLDGVFWTVLRMLGVHLSSM
ncbi:hypothetical protein [Pasteuria penetrans]|uniref:hypothetical protein n=1 Tax=Pasteuria penetrans TaxID=86005 RepID=UPI0011EE25A2|nr:hypothetical protein [Pasteuria penetrans]